MSRGLGLLMVGSVVVAVSLVAFATALAQEKKPEAPAPAGKTGQPPTTQPAGEKAVKEMMAKWMEVNQPGPPHETFKKWAGEWESASRFWMTPDAPPSESKGRAEFELLYGGRYLLGRHKIEMPEGSFEGMSLDAYDNVKKKYVSMWIDSLSTGVYLMTGTADAAGKVWNYAGTMDDPLTGEDKPTRMVMRWLNDDTVVMEMFEKPAGKDEFKNMEMTYTRKK